MSSKKPNIVFILSDDQGAWAMGCSGNSEIITPNMDRLAREGVRFENFFCASPVCSPARASLLTGRIPSQHGVHDWLRDDNKKQEDIEYLEGQMAYTDILSRNGYVCGLSGKWHLGKSSVPQKSFKHWFAHKSGGGPYYGAPFYREGRLVSEPGYVTDVITDDAISFMKEYAGKQPFYLQVGYTAPHAPWLNNHPKEYTDLYENCPFETCPMEPEHPDSIYLTKEVLQDLKANQIGYYAATTAMDRNIGRIMEQIEQLGIREETLIIFTSDNGFSCGQHGFWGKGNGTFPINMYESSVKVPFIASQPGVIPEGIVSEALVSAYDFMPTLLEYAEMGDAETEDAGAVCREKYNTEAEGTEAEDTEAEDTTAEDTTTIQLPGRSFLPALLGQEFEQDEHVVVMDEYGPNRMIRGRRYKYIKRYPYGPDELYDLAEDPKEQHNLLLRNHESSMDIRNKMNDKLEQWFLKYVNPEIDGAKEAVYGSGQINLAGVWSHGEISHSCDDYIKEKLRQSKAGE